MHENDNTRLPTRTSAPEGASHDRPPSSIVPVGSSGERRPRQRQRVHVSFGAPLPPGVEMVTAAVATHPERPDAWYVVGVDAGSASKLRRHPEKLDALMVGVAEQVDQILGRAA